MSDLNESGVTYTDVSSPFGELSDIGSPRADDHEHLELPEMLEDPYVEDQPYAEDATPTAQSPEYVPDSDLEAYPEDDDDEDPEEDPVDYPADRGDDGDDEEGSSKDDEDDDMDIEADEEEEEEHPAPADSVVVALTAADQAPSAEETEPFETEESTATPPPHPAYRMTARISIPAPVPVPAWSDSEIPFPPLPSILSPPSPVLSPAPPPSPIRSLGYQAAMIRLRAKAASTSHSPPLRPPFILSPTRSPSSGPPLLLPISTSTSSPPLDRRAHAYTRHLMETEARLSRDAWVRSTEASDLVRGKVMSLRTTVLDQMTEIRELHAADRRRQIVISEMLRAYHRRSTEIIGLRTDLQGQVTALQE
nr:hypothetical protein [Tanacetum cinerariifolium]